MARTPLVEHPKRRHGVGGTRSPEPDPFRLSGQRARSGTWPTIGHASFWATWRRRRLDWHYWLCHAQWAAVPAINPRLLQLAMRLSWWRNCSSPCWAVPWIWATVVGGACLRLTRQAGPFGVRVGRAVILGGGIALPLVIFTALLVPGLALIPALRAPPTEQLRIEVVGEQWWWRVTTCCPCRSVVSANEIRLPRGRRVQLLLSSPGVIHSLWIPPLAGKVDMIPGRINQLTVEPTLVGEYRGVCAEFCGTSHALMAFSVVVMEPEVFEQWLDRERRPAVSPTTLHGSGALTCSLISAVAAAIRCAAPWPPARLARISPILPAAPPWVPASCPMNDPA